MTPPCEHQTLTVNGIRMHVALQGQGPLCLLVHGWPGYWRTWRHQMPALADAGYRVAVPDMRGYGGTDAPDAIEAYDIHHLVGDLVALVGALGEDRATIVGHDWGASVAWQAAMMRPDLFTKVAALSVPARARGAQPPIESLRRSGQEDFYWVYFQEPGVAEAEFERDPRDTMRRVVLSVRRKGGLRVPKAGGFLDGFEVPEALPTWFPQADLDKLVAVYRRTGFRGGLNWYRNMDRNWTLTAPFAGARIRQPALFMAGTLDGVIRGPLGEAALAALPEVVPGLRRKVLLEGAGHWINEQRPKEVNAELLRFLSERP